MSLKAHKRAQYSGLAVSEHHEGALEREWNQFHLKTAPTSSSSSDVVVKPYSFRVPVAPWDRQRREAFVMFGSIQRTRQQIQNRGKGEVVVHGEKDVGLLLCFSGREIIKALPPPEGSISGLSIMEGHDQELATLVRASSSSLWSPDSNEPRSFRTNLSARPFVLHQWQRLWALSRSSFELCLEKVSS